VVTGARVVVVDPQPTRTPEVYITAGTMARFLKKRMMLSKLRRRYT
jgi:hypothetical protein